MAVKLTILSTDLGEMTSSPMIQFFDQETINIGRKKACNDVVLEKPEISGRHMTMRIEYDEFNTGHIYVKDLGSLNGTTIEGKLIEPQVEMELRIGQRISVGPYIIKPSFVEGAEVKTKADAFFKTVSDKPHDDLTFVSSENSYSQTLLDEGKGLVEQVDSSSSGDVQEASLLKAIRSNTLDNSNDELETFNSEEHDMTDFFSETESDSEGFDKDAKTFDSYYEKVTTDNSSFIEDEQDLSEETDRERGVKPQARISNFDFLADEELLNEQNEFKNKCEDEENAVFDDDDDDAEEFSLNSYNNVEDNNDKDALIFADDPLAGHLNELPQSKSISDENDLALEDDSTLDQDGVNDRDGDEEGALGENKFDDTLANTASDDDVQEFNFEAIKLFSISGQIFCKNNLLKNVVVSIGSEKCECKNGKFSFLDLEEGTRYDLNFIKDKYSFVYDASSGSLESDVTVKVIATKLYDISGQIKSQRNMPVSGVTVDAGKFGKTETDQNGNFQFLDVADGSKLKLFFKKAHYRFESKPYELVANDDLKVEILSTKLVKVNGYVRYKGEALEGVQVDGGEMLGVTLTDENGYYEFNDVPEGAKYKLTLSKQGYKFK